MLLTTLVCLRLTSLLFSQFLPIIHNSFIIDSRRCSPFLVLLFSSLTLFTTLFLNVLDFLNRYSFSPYFLLCSPLSVYIRQHPSFQCLPVKPDDLVDPVSVPSCALCIFSSGPSSYLQSVINISPSNFSGHARHTKTIESLPHIQPYGLWSRISRYI